MIRSFYQGSLSIPVPLKLNFILNPSTPFMWSAPTKLAMQHTNQNFRTIHLFLSTPLDAPKLILARPARRFLLHPHDIGGKTILLLINPFVYFNFKDWVGGLLARPVFKDKMDSAWNVTDPLIDCMHDIFDREVLRNFSGPDGKHFSVSGEEGRYVFSLCVDFFNPLCNKQAGKKMFFGLISLVCLNLPPKL